MYNIDITIKTEKQMAIISYANAHRSSGICFHLRHVDFSNTSLSTASGIMQAHINEMLEYLDSKMEIEEFTVGKTHTRSKSNRYFPVNDVDSWNLSGIRSAWKRFRELGFHNLIVVSVVDENRIPLLNTLWPSNDTEDFTIALNQKLIHYYKITKKDKRLRNQNFGEGARKVHSQHGVLFIAIKYKETTRDQSNPWLDLLSCFGLLLSIIVFGVIDIMCYMLKLCIGKQKKSRRKKVKNLSFF
ncbi:uncharacterized protein LOC133181449 [Saccostrea echinata]|uniref:uncharacterized protein LOC133181449 n=1 Tax=Saccostrea echinata TaxID=191078 RepID=UPI002A8276EE|nr:uncharacterized protein LOC133181449 [Saccostrea echinata]